MNFDKSNNDIEKVLDNIAEKNRFDYLKKKYPYASTLFNTPPEKIVITTHDGVLWMIFPKFFTTEFEISNPKNYLKHVKYYRKIKFDWLIQNKFLIPHPSLDHHFDYQRNFLQNNHLAYIGQYNELVGDPCGLCRVIYPDGNFYEGNYYNGNLNGFGIMYLWDMILVGYW